MGTLNVKLPTSVFLFRARICSREYSKVYDVTFLYSTKYVAYFLALQNNQPQVSMLKLKCRR